MTSRLRCRPMVFAVVLVLGASGVLVACEPPGPTSAKVNFQNQASTDALPSGFVRDFGEAFDGARHYGWIEQGSSSPLSIVGNGRDRDKVSDERLDSFVHMQCTNCAASGGVNANARWEHELADGTYEVTVGVGDASATNSVHRITAEGVLVVDNFVPTTTDRFAILSARVTVTDGRLTLDAAGGTNTKIDYVEVEQAPSNPAVSARVNFQPQSSAVPAGYVADFGEAYDAGRGYGWIAQDSTTPLSLVGNGRERNVQADQRLDTFMHMQCTNCASSGGVNADARWEYAIPNGDYVVKVAVGDAGALNSTHRIVAEGVVVINHFVPTSSQKFLTKTVRVVVNDGKLTLDADRAGGGVNTKIDYVDITSAPRTVVSADPTNGQTDVPVTTSVTLSLSHPADTGTIGSTTVKLIAPGGSQLTGFYNSDAAGSLVSFTPDARLATNTTYTIRTTSGLHDTTGAAFQPFTATFTTGSGGVPPAGLNFDVVTIDSVNAPTVVLFGPDGKLYAATATGQILRYTLGADGVPTAPADSLGPFGFQKTILGMAFDPTSTPSDLKLWVTNNALCESSCANFSDRISLLTGPNLETKRDVIVALPRSVRDHMTNGLAFGPDGRLYIAQGSLTGYGAPDSFWGNRPETKLSASILVADVNGDPAFAGTVNVNTANGYNPDAAGAPVKVYAKGTRNPYDLVWHSSGRLFVPVNEAANGNAPAGPGGNPPALTNLPPGRDFLARVQAGKYYGHPNPAQSRYVLNGGNPTSGTDAYETPQYPVGVNPEATWDRPIYDLGLHRSADGIAEYRASTFSGALLGKLLLTEFSNGDDLLAIGLDVNGDVNSFAQLAVGLNNPLDVVAHAINGNIYVAEYGNVPDGAGGKITLLRPA